MSLVVVECVVKLQPVSDEPVKLVRLEMNGGGLPLTALCIAALDFLGVLSSKYQAELTSLSFQVKSGLGHPLCYYKWATYFYSIFTLPFLK